METVEAIYENGIFKPISNVPKTLKEHERGRVIIDSEMDEDLQTEFEQWETASDEDFAEFEKNLGDKS